MRTLKLFLAMMLSVLCLRLSAQRAPDSPLIVGDRGSSASIYLTFDSKENQIYWTSADGSPDDRARLDDSTSFYYKRVTGCNVYVKWYNPMTYSVSFVESEVTDSRDAAVNGFVQQMSKLFTLGGTMSPAPNSGKSLVQASESAEGEIRKKLEKKTYDPNNKDKFTIDLKKDPEALARVDQKLKNQLRLSGFEKGFQTFEMNLLYLEFLNQESNLDSGEVARVNELTSHIDTLESMNYQQLKKDMVTQLKRLSENDEKAAAVKEVAAVRKELVEYTERIKAANKRVETIEKLLKTLKIKIIYLNNLATLIVSKYCGDMRNINQEFQDRIDGFKPILEIFDNSFLGVSVRNSDFQIKLLIEFDAGKEDKCDVFVRRRKLNFPETGMEVSSDTSLVRKTMSFLRHDPISPMVSTGIFACSSNLNAFGLAPGSSNGFLITSDDHPKEKWGAALYLNLPFYINSRYFEPLFQFGIDPTKKRPFLLVGGGIAIPTARFALTGGAVWSWKPSLTKFKVGDLVPSTTDLENDIQYNFSVRPIGAYIGVQFDLGIL